jgi:hypothetical protein
VLFGVPAWAPPAAHDEAYAQCFGPVLDVLEATLRGDGPAIGVLLEGRLVEDWSRRRPEAIQVLRRLLDAGRVELFASLLHGSVTSAIPERDAKAQLTAHTTLLKRILGVRPVGVWVPHGVWDPTLPRLFARAGFAWTALERGWLEQAGVRGARVLSVEREGRRVDVLPFERVQADPDDWSSRSGLHVVRLCDARGVRTVASACARLGASPSELVAGPRARAYLPAGGANGLWERVLLDDAGADALHKRMLATSRLVRRFERAIKQPRYSDDGPDPHALQQARRYLFRAQATEAYAETRTSLAVRARRGGSVLSAHRDRAWRDLLRAERTVLESLFGDDPGAQCDAEQIDLDCDATPEARLRTASWAATVAPEREGALTELSHLGCALNVFAQVPVGFRERWGLEPAALTWELVTTEPGGAGSMRAVLCADSQIDATPVRLTKVVQLPASGAASVRIEVENRGLEGARGLLSTELFCTLGGKRLMGGEDAPLSVTVAGGTEPLDEVVELPELDALGLVGWRARLLVELSPAARVRIEPLEHGTARLVLSWPVELWGRERERRTVRLNVRNEPK